MFILRAIWNLISAFKNALGNILLLTLVAAVIFGLISKNVPQVPKSAALVINPTGFIVNQTSAVDPVEQFLAGDQGENSETLARDLIDAIRQAKNDDRIGAIVLEVSKLAGSSLSLYGEIGKELSAFKDSGKPVYAFGDSFSQTQYFLASYADELYINADSHSFLGGVFLQGLGSYPLYLKEALNKLFVSVHVFKAGVYKDAAETLTRQSMSEYSRQATQLLVDNLWQSYLETVSRERGIAADDISEYIENYADILDDSGGDFGKLAVAQGLIDDEISRSDWRAKMQKVVGKSGDTYQHIDFRSYLAATKSPIRNPESDKIAVIVASGNILDGDHPPGQVGGDSVARLIREARTEDDIKAIVLRIDSPGGSASASELIRNELALTQAAGKPVVASFSGVAASGGYWIASTANRIFATETTITGSIGVFSIFPTAEQTLNKLGIKSDGVGTTSLSDAFDFTRSLNPMFAKALQISVDHTYDKFIALVSEGRGMTREAVDAIAQGRVWTGAQGLEHGLVDAIGGIDDALASAATLAGLDDYDLVYLEKRLTAQEQILQQLLNSKLMTGSALSSSIMSKMYRDIGFVSDLIEKPGVYLHCVPCNVTI